jgi:hypothetical protein
MAAKSARSLLTTRPNCTQVSRGCAEDVEDPDRVDLDDCIATYCSASASPTPTPTTHPTGAPTSQPTASSSGLNVTEAPGLHALTAFGEESIVNIGEISQHDGHTDLIFTPDSACCSCHFVFGVWDAPCYFMKL